MLLPGFASELMKFAAVYKNVGDRLGCLSALKFEVVNVGHFPAL